MSDDHGPVVQVIAPKPVTCTNGNKHTQSGNVWEKFLCFLYSVIFGLALEPLKNGTFPRVSHAQVLIGHIIFLTFT